MAIKQIKNVADIPSSELDDWGPVPPVVVATFLFSSTAAILPGLNGWTLHSAEGTVDAAIPCIWPQQRAAAFAVVKKLAGVSWHKLTRLMLALRASNY